MGGVQYLTVDSIRLFVQYCRDISIHNLMDC